MADLIERAAQATSIASLLGIEGTIARHYIQHCSALFKSRDLPTD